MENSKFIDYEKSAVQESSTEISRIYDLTDSLRGKISPQLKILKEGLNTAAIKEILVVLKQQTDNEECLEFAVKLESHLKHFDLYAVQRLIEKNFHSL